MCDGCDKTELDRSSFVFLLLFSSKFLSIFRVIYNFLFSYRKKGYVLKEKTHTMKDKQRGASENINFLIARHSTATSIFTSRHIPRVYLPSHLSSLP